MTTTEIDNLRQYVSQCNPMVNSLLRNNGDVSNLLFDNLFSEIPMKKTLFRLVPNEYICVQDNLYRDSAYLSCTTDIDKVLCHIDGENIACLQFDIDGKIHCIDVNKLLPESNDEGEFILQRGLLCEVVKTKKYSTRDEIQSFLTKVNSDMMVGELQEIYGIRSIVHYKCKIVCEENK